MGLRAGRWIQLAGGHDSGKTTVLTAFVRRLTTTGARVLVLKHTHHPVVDAKTDSGRYAKLGVPVVLVGDDGVRAEGLAAADWLALVEAVDWVVAEGGHAWPTPKVWLGSDEALTPAPPVVARLTLGAGEPAVDRLWQRRKAWSLPLAAALGLLYPTLRRPVTVGAVDPTPEEALHLLDAVQPPLGSEQVGLSEAVGRTLAEPVVAPVDCPPFARAAMDGYAVQSDHLSGGLHVLPVRGVVAAGSPPTRLEPGSALRILTGAPIPEGADAVIEQEAVRAAPSGIAVNGPVTPGRHIMPKGHEWRAGSTVFGTGERLTPMHVGVLAALGVESVTVRQRPRIAGIVTGDELTAPGRPLGPGQIFDVHSTLLPALVTDWGGDLVEVVRLGDHVDAVCRAVERLVSLADIVFVTGGVSVGDRDVVPEALERLGRLLFRRLRLHPGKASVAALVGTTPVIGLSGNPGAALTTWFAVVAPWWAHLHGGELHAERGLRRLVEPYPKASPYGRWIRVRQTGRGGVAWQDLSQASDVLSAYLRADGFVTVPAETGPLPQDTPLWYYAPSGMGARRPAWHPRAATL